MPAHGRDGLDTADGVVLQVWLCFVVTLQAGTEHRNQAGL